MTTFRPTETTSSTAENGFDIALDPDRNDVTLPSDELSSPDIDDLITSFIAYREYTRGNIESIVGGLRNVVRNREHKVKAAMPYLGSTYLMPGEFCRDVSRSALRMYPSSARNVPVHVYALYSDLSAPEESAAALLDWARTSIQADRTEIVPAIREPVPRLSARIMRSVIMATEEHFEDGIDNAITKTVRDLLATNGNQTLLAIRQLAHKANVQDEALAEMVRALGDSRVAETFRERLRFLSEQLRHESILVRDAAVTALGCLDSAQALPILVRALESEVSPYLRSDIEATIEDLHRTDTVGG